MELTYTIQRSSRRKTLSITVERDRRVIVHAPSNLCAEKIDAIIQSKRQWLYEKIKHPQKYQDLPHPPGKELVNGESALYLGRSYRIELVESATDDVQFKQKFLIRRSPFSQRQEVLRDWYIKRAKEKILPRVARLALELGVEYTEAKIVDNRYRWGSCTVKNNINLNWRLIKAPMFVIDYVIVHELAHLLEANHTPRFWNIVRTQTSTMEKAKAWLQENGQILEDVI